MKDKTVILAGLMAMLCLAFAGCGEGQAVSETAGSPAISEAVESPAVSKAVESPTVSETVESPTVSETVESPTVPETVKPEPTADVTPSAEPTEPFDEDHPPKTPLTTSRPIDPKEIKIILDAGHGGIDSGCGFDNVFEKDITLSVTLALKEKLEGIGIGVALTRTDDQAVGLDDRCAIANASGADLFVSIHCNSYTSASVKGFEGYYLNGDSDGKRLAELVLSAAKSDSRIATRNVKEDTFRVLRRTTMPAALFEIGYLSNETERAELKTGEYQAAIVQAIFDGIVALLS